MKGITRRKFLGTASAAGAGGLAATYAAPAARAAPLGAVFRRTDAPGIVVSHPSDWHLYPRLMTDLVAPAELFSLSSRALTPGPSFEESGVPDLSPLGSSDIAITVLGQRLGEGRNYSPGPPVSAGISLEGLTRATPAFAGIEQRLGWYLGPVWGYLVFVWNGGAADLQVADAVLRTIRAV